MGIFFTSALSRAACKLTESITPSWKIISPTSLGITLNRYSPPISLSRSGSKPPVPDCWPLSSDSRKAAPSSAPPVSPAIGWTGPPPNEGPTGAGGGGGLPLPSVGITGPLDAAGGGVEGMGPPPRVGDPGLLAEGGVAGPAGDTGPPGTAGRAGPPFIFWRSLMGVISTGGGGVCRGALGSTGLQPSSAGCGEVGAISGSAAVGAGGNPKACCSSFILYVSISCLSTSQMALVLCQSLRFSCSFVIFGVGGGGGGSFFGGGGGGGAACGGMPC